MVDASCFCCLTHLVCFQRQHLSRLKIKISKSQHIFTMATNGTNGTNGHANGTNGVNGANGHSAAPYKYSRAYLRKPRPLRIAVIDCGVSGIAAVHMFKERFQHPATSCPLSSLSTRKTRPLAAPGTRTATRAARAMCPRTPTPFRGTATRSSRASMSVPPSCTTTLRTAPRHTVSVTTSSWRTRSRAPRGTMPRASTTWWSRT